MPKFSLKPSSQDGGPDEQSAWKIVFGVFALVTLALLYDVFTKGFSGWEVIGAILWISGLAWLGGLGKKFYSAYAFRNVLIGAGAVLVGAILIFTA